MAQTLILLAIAVYLGFMIWIGWLYSKKNDTVDDFYLGGRKLGPFVTAMSAEASDMSSWLLMGLPGVAYVTGLAEASWTAIGLAIGTYLNWLIVAKRIRRYSHQLGAITVPQFFSKRWGDERSLLSAIAAVVIIIFFIPYTASGFSACGKLFSTLFGVDYVPAMLVSAAVIVLYTVLGGFLAASFTDLIQSIIMTIALVVVLGFGVNQAGGMDAVLSNAQSMAGYLSFTNIHDPSTGGSNPYGFLTICSLLAWGLGYFGMPHILLRFMAIEDEKKLTLSRRVASIWVVISMAVAIFIGVVGSAMTCAGALESLSDAETIIVRISSLISLHGPFAALLAGVILAGILAATMSTADSQLLAASSSVSQNLGAEFLKLDLSGRKGMVMARGTMVIIALIAAVLAMALAVGSSAAGILPEPIDVFAPLFGGTVAQTEVIDKIGHPIGASATDNGITISADAIMGDEYNAVIVYTLTREDGERFLPEGQGLDETFLVIGGFGGASWARGGTHGSAWFVDQDPEDNQIQYVETVSSDVLLTRGTAKVKFEELRYWDPESERDELLYEGAWNFRFEVDYEDCSVRMGGGETFTQDGLSFAIDSVSVSPIAVKVNYTADTEVVWSNSGSGRQDPEDARQSRRYLENVEILLTKTDGTVMDLSTSGGSLRPENGTTVCSKGQVLEEIIPLEELASISVGGVVYPIHAN